MQPNEPVTPFEIEKDTVSRLDRLVEFRDPLGPAAKQFLPRLQSAFLVERAEIAVRARLAGAGVQPRDLRVRLLGDGFRVELDPSAHAALATLPGLTAEVLTEMNRLGLAGAGRVGTYRSPTIAPAIGDSAVAS